MNISHQRNAHNSETMFVGVILQKQNTHLHFNAVRSFCVFHSQIESIFTLRIHWWFKKKQWSLPNFQIEEHKILNVIKLGLYKLTEYSQNRDTDWTEAMNADNDIMSSHCIIDNIFACCLLYWRHLLMDIAQIGWRNIRYNRRTKNHQTSSQTLSSLFIWKCMGKRDFDNYTFILPTVTNYSLFFEVSKYWFCLSLTKLLIQRLLSQKDQIWLIHIFSPDELWFLDFYINSSVFQHTLLKELKCLTNSFHAVNKGD